MKIFTKKEGCRQVDKREREEGERVGEREGRREGVKERGSEGERE